MLCAGVLSKSLELSITMKKDVDNTFTIIDHARTDTIGNFTIHSLLLILAKRRNDVSNAITERNTQHQPNDKNELVPTYVSRPEDLNTSGAR